MKRTVIALGLLLATSQVLAAGSTTNVPTTVTHTPGPGHTRGDTLRHKDHVFKLVEFWLRKIQKDL